MTRKDSSRLNSFLDASRASQSAIAGCVSPDNVRFSPNNEDHFIVIPVADVDRTVVNAIQYAKLFAGNIFTVHILIDPARKDRIERKWKLQGIDVPLIVIESPRGSIIEPLTEYVDSLLVGHKQGIVTIILPVIQISKWWHRFLFNQTARLIEKAFDGKTGVTTMRVPFSLTTKYAGAEYET